MNAFDDDRLGTLLDYADETVSLDIGAIVRAGRRRRRRQTAIAGAGVLTLTATGGVVATLIGGSQGAHGSSVEVGSPSDSSSPASRSLPATVTQSNDLLADYPPVGGSTATLASNANGWRAVAYVDAAGDLCFGSVEPSGDSHGACSPTGAFGNGPLVDNASGPNISAAATAPAAEAPSPHEIGVFGIVTTGETEPSNFQKVASVVVTAGDSSIHAALSPTAASMGSTTRLAGDERVWFAWAPSNVADGALRISSFTASGDPTGSQPLWLTPNDFENPTAH